MVYDDNEYDHKEHFYLGKLSLALVREGEGKDVFVEGICKYLHCIWNIFHYSYLCNIERMNLFGNADITTWYLESESEVSCIFW